MNLKTAKKIISNVRFGQSRNAARIKDGQGLTEKQIELTAEDLLEKYKQQNGKCHWSDIELDEQYNYVIRHPFAISVDRLNNKRGYVYDNTALTLRVFNLGRASYTGDFNKIIKELREKLK